MTDLKLCAYGTATLGALIDALGECNPDAGIYYDFCRLVPFKTCSYRGHYDHLAIGWREPKWPEMASVADLLFALKEAVGATFGGWKGGEFTMDRETPIWVDNAGHASSTAIVGVDASPHRVFLRTWRVG